MSPVVPERRYNLCCGHLACQNEAQRPLRDLYGRLKRAEDLLLELRNQAPVGVERARIAAKIEGVTLAISYLREEVER